MIIELPVTTYLLNC